MRTDPPFSWNDCRVAIVNRGDAAARALNALQDHALEHDLDLTTVAFHVEDEADAPFVRRADERHCIGPALVIDETSHQRVNAYTHLPTLERALRATGADAAWVGWGFVSESAAFAELCDQIGVRFIGPSAESLLALGDKERAKSLAESVGVPVVPWSRGVVRDVDDAQRAAAEIGYPLLVKATAGGGGRGIRRVDSLDQLEPALASASAEAAAAFGSGAVLLERCIPRPRHVEVQVVADHDGHTWPLGVRDCTVQRRRQKVIEEAGASLVDRELVARLESAAVQLARAASFTSVGTVEFLLDQDTGAFYFMEVNPRVQVEHTVTEAVNGVDLVRLQLDIAAGCPLTERPGVPLGHAIEVRLVAEDPMREFAPAPGRLARLQLPAGPGIRVDCGLERGSEVLTAFDSLICKVIAWGQDRRQALARLRRALGETEIVIVGGASNLGLLQDVLSHPSFGNGATDTGWLDEQLRNEEVGADSTLALAIVAAAVELSTWQRAVLQEEVVRSAAQGRPELGSTGEQTVELAWSGGRESATVAWQGPGEFAVTVGEHRVHLGVVEQDSRRRLVQVAGVRHELSVSRDGAVVQVDVGGWTHRVSADQVGPVRAPMAGVVVAVRAQAGDHVSAGQVLVVLESMKLEVPVRAEVSGTVLSVGVLANTQVSAGEPLAQVEPEADASGRERDAVPLLLESLVDESEPGPLLDDVRRALLGYDASPGWRDASVRALGAADSSWAGAEGDVEREVELLRIFVDVAAVTRRTRRGAASEAPPVPGAQAMLYAFMRRPESSIEALPDDFLGLLRRCLLRFGVSDLGSGPELWEGLFRLLRSTAALDEAADVLVHLMRRWLVRGTSAQARRDLDGVADIFTQEPDGRFLALAHAMAAVLHGDELTRDGARLSWAVDGPVSIPADLADSTEAWRLDGFEQTTLAVDDDLALLAVVARENQDDRRLVVWGRVPGVPEPTDDRILRAVEQQAARSLTLMRSAMVRSFDRPPDLANRVVLHVCDPWNPSDAQLSTLAPQLAARGGGLSLDKVLLRIRRSGVDGDTTSDRVIHLAAPGTGAARFGETEPAAGPMRAMTAERMRRLRLARRGLHDPYEVIDLLVSPHTKVSPFPSGRFVEYDLELDGRVVPVRRGPNENTAGVVVGTISNDTPDHPDGMRRVIILSDPSKRLGSLSEPECRRILGALDLAEDLGVPVEWFAVSAGAQVSMSAGTENLDWVALVLRRIVELTDRGREINVVVAGVTVGAQPYFQAEATMLMHTKGILVMVQGSSMVLTGKDALDFAGAVSAEDNPGIGGFERVMGGNGEAQYWARDLEMACEILFRHYEHAYVAQGEPGPRARESSDPVDRDVSVARHPEGTDFATVGDIFDDRLNPGRRKPFHMRRVLDAVVDADCRPLERWTSMTGAEGVIVWDAHLGGDPVCLIGIESHNLPRWGPVASDGPRAWNGSTLFPRSSKKMARAINAASGNRPVVILANLAGFDGSPESMRELQLEYGAEIARAVTRFQGPLVFCIVSRNHGGAFVVFSKQLNDQIHSLAVRGAQASVIGGSAAAAVVFAREVEQRTMADERVVAAREAWAREIGAARVERSPGVLQTMVAARADARTALAHEFDAVHTVERALDVGSVDQIVTPQTLRAELIAAVRRGLARQEQTVPRSAKGSLTKGLTA